MVIKNISESITFKNAFDESERRRLFALDAAGIGDWDMDLMTGVATRSLRHDQCFGYQTSVKDWDYEKFVSHIHPDDKEKVERVYKVAMLSAAIYDVEFRAIWPDDSIHWLWSKGRFYPMTN